MYVLLYYFLQNDINSQRDNKDCQLLLNKHIKKKYCKYTRLPFILYSINIFL